LEDLKTGISNSFLGDAETRGHALRATCWLWSTCILDLQGDCLWARMEEKLRANPSCPEDVARRPKPSRMEWLKYPGQSEKRVARGGRYPDLPVLQRMKVSSQDSS
jgi:hypothetical protein